ncbi:MAG: hypothetical protein LCH35_09885 [Bacteroidetes bacterium]|uniref:hypothetical protein n=1 Tax=Flavobacterium sp. TaxID=239 RepID=UPI002FDA14F0|nr:hypothetical protein [Bacteroidota bacterium]
MKENKLSLMKLFSLVLKERAKEENQTKQISPNLLKFFSRKELIEIINHIYDGVIPEEYELVDMENGELLKVIGDDFSIISYVTNKWSKEVSSETFEIIPAEKKEETIGNAKPKDELPKKEPEKEKKS